MNASNSSQNFAFERFILVVKRFYFLNQKNWLIGILGITGLLFLFWFLPVMAFNMNPDHFSFSRLEGAVTFFYVVGGFALTSRLFHEVHSPGSAFQLLTLPATNLEKFFAAWIISTVGYTIIAMLAIVFLSATIETISAFQLGTLSNFSLFNPFDPIILYTIEGYFYYQCIFFLGAIYFKKNNFLKTLLSAIIFVLSILFILGMVGLFYSLFYAEDFSFQIQLSDYLAYAPSYLSTIIGIIFMSFMLFLSYLQIKNKQVA